MVVSVHSGTKPALPGRSWALSIALFGITAALAATMASQRAGDPLGKRTSVTDWSISFRPPRRSMPAEGIASPLGATIPFAMQTDERSAILYVFRLDRAVAGDAFEACDRIPRLLAGSAARFIGGIPLTWTDKKLGPADAIQTWEPALGVYTRVALFGQDEMYAVSLQPVRGEITDEYYSVFEAVCRSIRYIEP